MTISAGDFRLVDSQVIFDHPGVRVVIDTIEHDNRQQQHVRLTGAGVDAAIAIVAVTPDGQIILTRQYRPAMRDVIYGLPAGRLKAGETPIEGARREFEEETGYRAGNIVPVGHFYQFPGTIAVATHLFFVSDFVETRQQLEEGEELEVVFVRVNDVVAMIARGEIVDGALQLGVLLSRLKGLLP